MSLVDRLIAWAQRRPPNFVIGGADDPYLRRWWLIPRNPVFNVYLHEFLRGDDDRALHCHPWVNASRLLRGRYLEHLQGGIVERVAGEWVFRRSGRIAHRVELHDGPAWTLFLTGPRYRSWGFYCPQGFVHWRAFTSPADVGTIGKGCDQ